MDAISKLKKIRSFANQIAKSNKLDPYQKSEYFTLLNKIYENLEEYQFFDTYSGMAPFDFFDWQVSPEGYEFWLDSNRKFHCLLY